VGGGVVDTAASGRRSVREATEPAGVITENPRPDVSARAGAAIRANAVTASGMSVRNLLANIEKRLLEQLRRRTPIIADRVLRRKPSRLS
jgi:hypothetical protein